MIGALASRLRDLLRSLDPLDSWAAQTEEALHEPAFQRDVDFLRTIVPLMEVWSRYFAGEVRGFEHVPTGPVLLVGNHSGGPLVPDTPIFLAHWYRQRGFDAPLIGLALDAAFGIPGFERLMRRIGEVPASRENARRALETGAAVLVYPGGDHDAFRPWTERNRVDFDGRTGFIKLALQQQVPVVPVVSHGGHDTTCILTRGEWLGTWLGMERLRTPTFPIALQIPWGLSPSVIPGVPLPAKTVIDVLEPMPWDALAPEAADDPVVVRECYDEIIGRMQAGLDRLVAEHPFPLAARAREILPW